MKVRATLLLRHAREMVTCAGELPTSAARADFDAGPLGLVADGAVAVNAGCIVAAGPTASAITGGEDLSLAAASGIRTGRPHDGHWARLPAYSSRAFNV